jgi:hypothetical protein
MPRVRTGMRWFGTITAGHGTWPVWPARRLTVRRLAENLTETAGPLTYSAEPTPPGASARHEPEGPMTAPTELPIELTVPVEASDADAVDQARQVRPDGLTAPTRVHEGSEADEYDAVEQSVEIDDDEDAYR